MLKNKYIVIVMVLFSSIACILSATCWFIEDEGNNILWLVKNVKGLYGTKIDSCIEFSFLSSIIIPSIFSIPILFIVSYMFKYKTDFSYLPKVFMLILLFFSIAILIIAISSLITTINLFDEKWVAKNMRII